MSIMAKTHLEYWTEGGEFHFRGVISTSDIETLDQLNPEIPVALVTEAPTVTGKMEMIAHVMSLLEDEAIAIPKPTHFAEQPVAH